MASLKREFGLGIFYTAISKYMGMIVSLVVTGVLARLIVPEDFGVIAIATVIITFFGIFSDLGLAPAIVQNKTLTQRELSHLFSFSMYLSLFLSLAFFFSSGAIASFYDNDKLVVICQLLSLNLFFVSLNVVPNGILYKGKEFRFIAMRTLVVQITGGVISVIAALNGAGVYALLINPIYSSVALFLLSFARHPLRFYLVPDINALKKVFSFSSYQFLFNLINYFSRNADKLLIGKYMNMNMLGFYEKSYRLMMLPLQNITHVITPVMHPVLSEYQNDRPKLISSYEKVVRLVAFLGFPLSAVLFFTAAELIMLFFGDAWAGSVASFEILALSVGVQIISSTSGAIYQAAGDTRSLFVCGLFSSLLNVAGIAVGIFWLGSIEGVASCILVTFIINFVQCYLWMYYVTFKQSLASFVAQLWSPLLLGVLIAAGLWLVSAYCGGLHFLVSLGIKGFVSLALFAAYVYLTGEYTRFRNLK